MKKTAIALAFFGFTTAASASPAYIQQSPFVDGAPALTINAVDFSSLTSQIAEIVQPLRSSGLPAATALQTGFNQRAEIVQGGFDNLGLIVQQGGNNSASLFQSGSANLGFIHQAGYNNSAFVRQSGVGHSAAVVQHGSNNVAIVRQY